MNDIQHFLPPLGTLIAGHWLAPTSALPVLDKYTRTVIADVGETSADHVAQAVSVVRQAADAGVLPPPATRAQHLRKAAELLAARREQFACLMTAEAGFTRADSDNEINRAIITLNLSAEAGVRLIGDVIPFAASPGAHNRVGFTQRFPVGVVCAITPFNSPLNTVLHKVAPAYAGGNAAILKPSPYTPLTAAALAALLLEAEVPPEFIALVHGGDAVGAALTANPGIDFFTFTGSTRVGRIIQAAAGLRRTQMELGSIASTLVCGDADLDRAIPKIINAGFRKAGQVCTSVQRLYVAESLYPSLLDRLCQEARKLKAGDPRDPDTLVGPLISLDAAVRTSEWIAKAVDEGATLEYGGERKDAVVNPTVLTHVAEASRAWCQEAFAPIMSLRPFTRLDEAIHDANATPFGLSVGVFTQDIDQALHAARTLRFGAIHINAASSARSDVMPFGGVKASGFGREGPDYAIREMTEDRLVTINQ
jgi:succinate-semialdehyde dehydrogenase/glutarate-semialdehyde dehydrogenase